MSWTTNRWKPPVTGVSVNFSSPLSYPSRPEPTKLELYAATKWVRCLGKFVDIYPKCHFKNRHKNAQFDPKVQRHHLAIMLVADLYRGGHLKEWLQSKPKGWWRSLNYEHIAMLDCQEGFALHGYMCELAIEDGWSYLVVPLNEP